MGQITAELLHRALGLLGELMVLRKHPGQHFVVCGGASLLALGLVRRAVTQDVDILGRIDVGEIVSPRPLPDWLLSAADDVRTQLNLPHDWLNAHVAEDTLFKCGLPDGLAGRLTTRDYGPLLRISFIARRDQIFLKLHAAVDRDGGRHLQDLLDLRPDVEELLAAGRWTRTQDPSEGFRFNLGIMLTHLGHGSLVGQL
ncbi:MAG: hypothetical protein HY736_21230 [Verrucomicrobia bacterium]|nr:hypothetical protein [Verrucomicrobiota bacterium]